MKEPSISPRSRIVTEVVVTRLTWRSAQRDTRARLNIASMGSVRETAHVE